MTAAIEKIMLLNAIHEDELRVAIVSAETDGRLLDCDFERPRRKQHKGDIIYAEIKHIEPSLDAAFVDIGSPTQRHGFLPFKEVACEYYQSSPHAESAPSAKPAGVDTQPPLEMSEDTIDNPDVEIADDTDRPARPPIKEALKESQRVIVQIDKGERGKKGAALTTYISLAGCYLVLMPNNPRAGGISRRVNPEDRDTVRDILNELNIPEGMGLIVRTAGVGRSLEELQWDLEILLKQWENIKASAADARPAPYLIHQESDIIVRTIRDYLRPDVSQIIIDSPDIYEKVKKQIELLRPDYANRVKLYSDTVALFTRYNVEKQIETAFQREVRLPSGGAVVIDHTEALTSIDVNSSRSTGGGDIEETALHTNLEAAQAIATQLRLRDLGGLIVVDFIDMTPIKNQKEVERYFYDCLKSDKARVQMGRISRFGLLEMSRQRLRPSIEESNQVMCPRCDGQGLIRSVESLSLSIMRFLEEEAMKTSPVGIKPKIFAYVPTDVATFILNEKRDDIANLDNRFDVSVLVIPNPNFETPHYQIERVTDPNKVRRKASYQLIESKQLDKAQLEKLGEPPTQILEPVVKAHASVAASSRAQPQQQNKTGLLKRILSSLVGESDESDTTNAAEGAARTGRGAHGNSYHRQSGGNRHHQNRSRNQGGNRRRSSAKGSDSRRGDNRRDNDAQSGSQNRRDNDAQSGSQNRRDNDARSGGGQRRGGRGGRSGGEHQRSASHHHTSDQQPRSEAMPAQHAHGHAGRDDDHNLPTDVNGNRIDAQPSNEHGSSGGHRNRSGGSGGRNRGRGGRNRRGRRNNPQTGHNGNADSNYSATPASVSSTSFSDDD